jgi:CheY-like chemotaxis protein
MRLPGKNILVVDDDPSLRMLLGKILDTVGCNVDEAPSVRVAIQRIEKKLPDLIILDLSMPEHDGFILLKFREQNKLLQSIPVLVLSSSTEQSIVDRALAMGASQFLEKPLRANQVLQKLRFLFYSQEHFSYRYPEGSEPSVTSEVKASITGFSENQLKIKSSVKFSNSSPLVLQIDNYKKFGGSDIVGRIDNRKVDLDDGLYGQYLTFVGLSQEEKEKIQAWGKTL